MLKVAVFAKSVVEPVHHTFMGISPQPVDAYTRTEVRSGGNSVTNVTEKHVVRDGVVTVSKSSVTLYDRFGQTHELVPSKSTKEIFA